MKQIKFILIVITFLIIYYLSTRLFIKENAKFVRCNMDNCEKNPKNVCNLDSCQSKCVWCAKGNYSDKCISVSKISKNGRFEIECPHSYPSADSLQAKKTREKITKQGKKLKESNFYDDKIYESPHPGKKIDTNIDEEAYISSQKAKSKVFAEDFKKHMDSSSPIYQRHGFLPYHHVYNESALVEKIRYYPTQYDIDRKLDSSNGFVPFVRDCGLAKQYGMCVPNRDDKFPPHVY